VQLLSNLVVDIPPMRVGCAKCQAFAAYPTKGEPKAAYNMHKPPAVILMPSLFKAIHVHRAHLTRLDRFSTQHVLYLPGFLMGQQMRFKVA
jgi:hypothetical protein